MSNKERKRLRLEKMRAASEKQRLEHEQLGKQREKEALAETGKKNKKRNIIYSAVIIALVVGAYSAYSYYSKPGSFNDFAKCLSDKGAVMYGADWCKYTQEQRAMFGKSFKHVESRDYTEGPDIKITPTWVIDGKLYERVQSFEHLSALTGCEI